MPQRKVPLVTGEYYHVFNRSINKESILTKAKDCQRAIVTLSYYKTKKPPIRLSYYLALGVDRRQEIIRSLFSNAEKLVDIISFVLMPNHFHLLVKQTLGNGISKFLAQFQNSYTRYFNTKYARQGHLFQGQFKVVRIEDDQQLLHINRYIHLNPYTSFVVKSMEELERNYPYSSLPEYLRGSKDAICNTEIILSHFPDTETYKKFIFDQADYQRKLEIIKHLMFE